MTSLKFCMLAIMGVCVAMIIKQWRSDFLPLVRLGVLLLLGTAAISAASPLITYLSELTKTEAFAPYSGILLKALAIAILTQYAAEICRECGESSVASGVEMTGKIEILLLCLPLVNEILEAAQKLLSLS